jgi:hypothetical protein
MITYLLAAHFTVGVAVGVGLTLWLLSRPELEEPRVLREADEVLARAQGVRR